MFQANVWHECRVARPEKLNQITCRVWLENDRARRRRLSWTRARPHPRARSHPKHQANRHSPRNPTLDAVPNVQILTLDIADDASIEAAASSIPELDTLIINAGVGTRNPVTASSTADLETYLDVNLLGPHRTIRAFLPALRARTTRRIVAISSSSGSLAQQAAPGSGGLAGCYGVSKAALNMLVVQCHKELHKEGFTVVPVHPGWVATDMGNQHGSGGMSPATSAKAILKLVDELTPEKSGTFYRPMTSPRQIIIISLAGVYLGTLITAFDMAPPKLYIRGLDDMGTAHDPRVPEQPWRRRAPLSSSNEISGGRTYVFCQLSTILNLTHLKFDMFCGIHLGDDPAHRCTKYAPAPEDETKLGNDTSEDCRSRGGNPTT
ncbi:hypothetical protein B0H13DRAFT_1888079 [Mycena leptocephala]|nr:hypothetical protein B0H13DRAFT_1888079 [Mycena leptocephala]